MKEKIKEMISKDTFLYSTIKTFTQDVDKIYEIFCKLNKQDSWRISDIEKML